MKSRMLTRAVTAFATLAIATCLAGPARAAEPIIELTLDQGATSVTLHWVNGDTPTFLAESVFVYDATCTDRVGVIPITPPSSGSMEFTTSSPLSLPPGAYGFAMGAVVSFGGSPAAFGTDCLPGILADGSAGAPGPASWWQSVGRHTADAPCPAGWNPSWAEWMNAGKGGFVCNREIYWAGSGWATR